MGGEKKQVLCVLTCQEGCTAGRGHLLVVFEGHSVMVAADGNQLNCMHRARSAKIFK